MTCVSPTPSYTQSQQLPISFTQWKTILSKLRNESIQQRLSSTSNSNHRTKSHKSSASIKKSDHQSLPRNQVFEDAVVDSFFVSSSSSSNVVQSSMNISRQVSSPTKRYVSSFKTIVDSTTGKPSQRISYVNDSVIILKLSKENASDSTGTPSQVSSKSSAFSMSTTSTATTTHTPYKQLSTSPSRLSPLLKIEGQKRRTTQNDSYVNPSVNIETNMMMSATTHPSLFSYRSTVAGTSPSRHKVLPESTTNHLLITTERLKSNISSAMRPSRQPATITMPSTSVQPQRNVTQNTRQRSQQDKLNSSKNGFDYPDPFTNCPQDLLSKLAQLTKLQLETVEWEKKRRFVKKKQIANGSTPGKDSP